MEQTEKRQKTIKTIIGLIVGAAVFITVQLVFFQKQSFDKAMLEAADEINKSCPMMVDKETRLDNAAALPDNVFQYNYTLINANKSDIDIEDFTIYMEPIIVNNVKTNPDLKIYRENKVTMSYYYKDKNSLFLTKIVVTPDKYSN